MLPHLIISYDTYKQAFKHNRRPSIFCYCENFCEITLTPLLRPISSRPTIITDNGCFIWTAKYGTSGLASHKQSCSTHHRFRDKQLTTHDHDGRHEMNFTDTEVLKAPLNIWFFPQTVQIPKSPWAKMNQKCRCIDNKEPGTWLVADAFLVII